MPVHVFLQNETTGTPALKGQTDNRQANPIVTMLERVTIIIVVMGRSNSSGLCSVATWMHAIFF